MAVLGALARVRRRASVLGAVMWGGVYAVLALTGEHLSTRALDLQWQLLSVDALEKDPFGSVLDLHIQPPLWNLLVGVLARWSPLPLALSLQLVLVACGCLLAGCIASIARSFGLGLPASLGVTALATLNGWVLLAAFRPQYELPVAALLATLVWLATRQPGRRSDLILIGAAATITTLALTRSLYHPLLIPVVLLLVWRGHAPHLHRRAILGAAAIPLLLVGGWMVKNEVRFDRATMSSWTGMNLLRSVQPAIDPDDLEELADDGTITGVGATPGTFGRLEDYAGAVGSCTPVHDGETLTRPFRTIEAQADGVFPIDQVANFNHECYLPIYDAAQRDAIAIARAKPDRWLLARVWSTNNWWSVEPLEPSSALGEVIAKLSFIELASLAHPPVPSSWDEFWVNTGSWSLTVLVASGLVLVLAARRLGRLRRGELTPQDSVTLLVGGLLLWTMAAGILFELGEQARFRAPTDPLVLAIAGVAALRWYTNRAERVATEPVASEPAPPREAATGPRRSVTAAAAAVVVGIALVVARQGTPTRFIVDADTAAAQVQAATAVLSAAPTAELPPPTSVPRSSTTAEPPTTAAPQTSTSTAPAPTTTAPAPAPTRSTCTFIAHIGDSNLGMTAGRFKEEYDARGLESVIDFSNGRGAEVVKEGTTALQAISTVQATSPAEGRCWIIALSGADAVQTHLEGADPRPSIRLIADAVGNEPVIWIPPVLTSATTEWNLLASTAYDIALAEVVAGRPNVFILDWPSIAVQHLDQFQNDGVHYTKVLYDLLIETVLSTANDRWELRP